ncbi:MAG: methylated-DNA--[protein]-cysteine S-methyltransferase [Planctomycetes bacterium]|nr:methylated-DNA--[protein]-cysteine S-methyltransferase [Planctomycetota bacterium]
MNKGIWKKIKTSAGTFHALITPAGLARLLFPGSKPETGAGEKLDPSETGKAEAIAAILEKELPLYFEGKINSFTVPVDLTAGTPFRRKVWNRMKKIPHSKVMTYGELAKAVDCASARAIGQACGANPVPIVVPCHRVVASDGKIGGWSGGKGMKEKLLHLEGVEI